MYHCIMSLILPYCFKFDAYFRLLDGHPDKLHGTRSRYERVVIVKNLFDSTTFDKDVSLLLEYQQDLHEKCSKCGDVKQVVICDVR
jgi:HIV Tat-specific factor 1